MKAKQVLAVLSVVLLVALVVSGCGTPETPEETDQEKFVGAVDVDYAYEIAVKLADFVNSELGGRNSGSQAEHDAAEYLAAQMERIGLSEVGKDQFTAAKWQFNGAELTVIEPDGEEKSIKPYSYASGGTSPEGITAELIYAGTGIKDDYEGLDVKDKIVLVDINMWDDWWVNHVTLEAAYQGAAAIINNQTGGYAQLNKDAMNCFDFCGPVTIPSVNISCNDAGYLKGLLEKNKVTVNLVVDNLMEPEGTSYNVVGKLPGKTDEEYIIIGDHYDCHFWGFQDDSCGVGLTLAIAKAMIDSGYEPERTIWFVLHGSEEYGAIDTRYDWSIGAYRQVFNVRPEWAGKSLAYINFELPAYEYEDSTHVESAFELYSFLGDFISTGPEPENCFKDGVLAGFPQNTWSDDWSYTIAGIPSLVNGWYLMRDEDDTNEFQTTIYHTQFDTSDTYNKHVLDFNIKFYGALAIAFDKNPALALDFTHQASRLQDSIDREGFELAGYDPKPLEQAIEALEEVAAENYTALTELNRLYAKLVDDGNPGELLEDIKIAARAANKETLAAFKACQDGLLRLDWNDLPIVGHEQPQLNIMVLAQAIELLENKEVDPVLDDLLWQIEDEWYSYYFSREVIQHETDIVVGPDYQDNLFWGTGRVVGYVDLYEVIQSLLKKYGTTGADCSKEITSLTAALDSQKALLEQLVAEEIASIQDLTQRLNKIDLADIIEQAKRAAGEE